MTGDQRQHARDVDLRSWLEGRDARREERREVWEENGFRWGRKRGKGGWRNAIWCER